jgi:repressor LexA
MRDFDLTANQQRVLDCIERHLDQNGVAPTLREISEYLGLSSHSSAQDYIDALIRKGAIERSPKHRGLRLAQRTRALGGATPLVSSI